MKISHSTPLFVAALTALPWAAQTVRVHADAPGHAINPAIYGFNMIANYTKATYLAADTAGLGSDRMGGNRMTGFNWENNFSSAGSDWQNSSDDHLMQNPLPTGSAPGAAIASFVERNLGLGRAPIVQLQMAGYVAADGGGTVTAAEQAPSARWKKVVFAKNAPFDLAPSSTDSAVYMDEEVNFLVQKFGKASAGGVPYYSLDNEPALWSVTHSRIHPQFLTFKELLDNTQALASAVKAVDPSAKVLGSESFGAMEMWECLSVTTSYGTNVCSDWSTYSSKYGWAVSAFLGEMKKRSEAAGKRLVDVLAIHWYPEDKGDTRINDASVANGGTAKDIEARLQAPRSLWDTTYLENSWVTGLTGNKPVHILTRTLKAIDTTWAGTRLALTEYNYGGENHWSGGLAQADALGVFGKYDLEAATLHTQFTGFESAAFRLYRNFDGQRNAFGDTHVPVDNSDAAVLSTYASLDSKNPKLLHIVAINKSSTAQATTFTLAGGAWKSAAAWGFSTDSVITKLPSPQDVSSTGFDYTLPATSATHFVVSTDAQVTLPVNDRYTLNIEIVGQGRVDRSVKTILVPAGTKVELGATPADGWVFGGWGLDATGTDRATSIVMDKARTVRATFLSGANLVTNGDFSNGTVGWTPSAWSQDGSAKGTSSVANGAFSYVVTNGGTAGWNVQLFQSTVPYVKGITYKLEFDAWASTARSINVYANQGALDKSVSLETTSTPFSYTFVSDSTETGRLSFDMGGSTATGTTVWLDNVVLKAVLSNNAVPSSARVHTGLRQNGHVLDAEGHGQLTLFAPSGRIVLARTVEGSAKIDLSALPRGIYLAKFGGSLATVRNLD